MTQVWRFGSAGDVKQPTTIIELDGELYELDALSGQLPQGPRDVFSILSNWSEWEPALNDLAANGAAPAAEIDWLPPVVFPRKLVCIGANYQDHLDEMDSSSVRNRAPYAFLKPPSTGLLGSGRTLHLPDTATWIDWEGELAIVIGREMHHVKGAAVFDHIAGYTMLNDVSNRDLMDHWQPIIGMDWVIHKGYDGFAPAGPLLTPARFVSDPQNLDIELTIDGVVKQSSNTSKMIFGIQEILEHLNTIMTLEPGDMIATGSPAGVGYGREPRERLEPGNEVRLTIKELGRSLVTTTAGPGPAPIPRA